MNIQDYKGVFVFTETVNGAVSEVAYELIGRARDLAADLSTEVTAVILGDGSLQPFEKLSGFGAQNIIAVKHPLLDTYRTGPFTRALQQVVEQYKPEIMLFGATAIGRDLAPRLSARLRTGLTADCTKLEVDAESKDLMMTRPAFGGNLMATILCSDHRPQMATVRPGVMQKCAYVEGAMANVIHVDAVIDASDDAVEILQQVVNPPAKLSIREANILVSGGRGMGAPENFEQLEKVADLLGGTMSSSRAAVDSGWVAKDRQVGQTGQTVRPDLYIACGISGAIQHVAGMEESGYIIAINKDETAPIFGIADLGIVGDVHKVLPALEKRLEETMK